jgi:hypothetical protein
MQSVTVRDLLFLAVNKYDISQEFSTRKKKKKKKKKKRIDPAWWLLHLSCA